MEFKSDKAIYEQIAEYVCEKVLRGEWKDEERMPSVREFAVSLTVNPNTVMRAYEHLERHGIIYSKRGIGFSIGADSRQKAAVLMREDFLKSVPAFVSRMKLLGIDFKDLERYA
ncbi:MAG: GntR family transcriptional regulator [Bacteroidales bacterium]|nr:GntR family transcriptional regulator [Bacteroidales bacterium]MDE7102380.1 GntR family transcriptional regulator [Bacteroidales bacterium]